MKLSCIFSALVICIYGCSAPIKDYSESFTVTSKNFRFIDALLNDSKKEWSEEEIVVWLTLPDNKIYSPPYAAVILLHSSWGLSSQEQYYANVFKQMGVATLAIDSFRSRGVRKTSLDQSRVSTASMINDAYAVLNYLQQSPQFQGDKIALMGFSKGGIVALYSALETIKGKFPDSEAFAAHIAYYPWCGMRLNNMTLTGVPILLQGGEKDIVTPIKSCQKLIDDEIHEEQKSLVFIYSHENARHAFDHPVLARIPIPISMNAQVPVNCDFREESSGEFVELYTNRKISGENIKSILDECSSYNGVAGYNKRATQHSLSVTKEFIEKHLLHNRDL